MQQQINLFQPVFRREQKVFSARTLLQILGLGLLLLIGTAAALQLQRAQLAATRDFLSAQQKHHTAQLQQLEASVDAEALASLEQRIETLQSQLAADSGTRELLRAQLTARQARFAPQLTALARHPLPGLWLTGVQLGSDAVTLQGLAQRAEQVPQYLASLAGDPLLSRWALSTVRLERDSAGRIQFTLSSAREDGHG